MTSISFDRTRSYLLNEATLFINNNSSKDRIEAEKYLEELVNRLPTNNDDEYDEYGDQKVQKNKQRLDPHVAHEITIAQRLLGQTSFALYQENDNPMYLEKTLNAYKEATRTAGRYPEPELLIETIKAYRSFGSHEGALNLCIHLIQNHPTHNEIGQVVMHAIACMIQLKVNIPGQYIQWLCEMPTVSETDALLLTARATELRGERETARQGYREIFLRLMKERRDEERKIERRFNAQREETKEMSTKTTTKEEQLTNEINSYRDSLLIGKHTKWDAWCEDSITWIKAGRCWFDKKEYECSNAMFGAALHCSSLPGNECMTKLIIGDRKSVV